VTAPTAPAAGVHLPWAQVPAAVRSWADGFGEAGPPVSVRDLQGGFSPGATSLLEWPGRTIFVKAVGPELNPESPAMHRREARISALMPRSPRYPHLLEAYDDGGWVALAFEAVDGQPPRHPWEPGELAQVADALATMHAELTPSPVPDIEALSAYAVHLFGGWSTLASLGAPDELDPWAAAHLDRLAELESGWPEACAGQTLVHGDVRADNVLIAGERVMFVDWPHACVGNAAFDVVAWAPSVSLEGGPPPEELLALHDLLQRSDPDSVTVLLAAISGFFVSRSLTPAGPGLPTLRAFQAAQGAVALEWLQRRTGW
jgi:Ser/Thr protein kinase RdoA (MazF antagonist)